nr:uncharacterized protein LOC125422017 [Ziziphus jujuba var. spinosa]
MEDPKLRSIKSKVQEGFDPEFSIRRDGALVYKGRLCVLDIPELKKDLEFEVEDWVFLKLSSWKGFVRFGRRGKLSPRYIGPYEIIERIGLVAYRLALAEELAWVHNMFHISMLQKYIADPSHMLETPDIELREDLSYVEQPVQILDREEQVLCNKTILLVKVLWQNHRIEEATWEPEAQMREQYPNLSSDVQISRMKFL